MEITRRREGVEEKKEEIPDNPSPPRPVRTKSEENEEEERNHGFQAQIENLARIVFGTCGTAMEAATVFVQGETCDPHWQSRQPKQEPHPVPPPPPPLSISDELRRLAAKEGKVWGGPRAEDIPRFLGEEAVNSFEDDNISAISQHTLEDLAQSGDPAAQRRVRQQQRLAHQNNQNRLMDDSFSRPPGL